MSEFKELYNLYYKDVYYFVLKLSGYRDSVAEEVTQESFYQAFISLKRFRGECSVKSWLCQIAKNTYYVYQKKNSKETALDESIDCEEAKPISSAIEEMQMTRHIIKVMEKLDERSRAVVEYRLFAEKSYREIGDLLSIREATAKVLFFRAKVKIQQRLKEDYGYEI